MLLSLQLNPKMHEPPDESMEYPGNVEVDIMWTAACDHCRSSYDTRSCNAEKSP